MKDNIQVMELVSGNDYQISLIISDVQTEEEALMSAEDWCDENNSLVVGKPQRDEGLIIEGKSVFKVKVISDDYK